jgi:hypothetical protein
MAQTRVPVERMRPSTQLQAVARPVETYVRPPEIPAQESSLGAFVRAIAPAVEASAEVKYQKKLKQQREAEKGIALKRAYDIQIGLGQYNRQATQDYRDNRDEYLELTTEEVAERRAEIFAPLLEKALASEDEQLITAFKGDVELANLDFFMKIYDKDKQDYIDGKELEALSTEVLAISRGVADINNKEQFMNATSNIDNLVNNAHQATGISYRRLNEYLAGKYEETATEDGRSALYGWLNGKNSNKINILDAGWATTIRESVTRKLAIRDANALKATEDAEYQNFLANSLNTFTNAPDKTVLKIGDTFTARSGKEFTIKEEDYVKLFEAQYLGTTDQRKILLNPTMETAAQQEQILDFYRSFGTAPTFMQTSIKNGMRVFSGSGVNTEEDILTFQAAITSYDILRGYGLNTNWIDSKLKEQLMIGSVLVNEMSDSPDAAILKIQQLNLDDVSISTLVQKSDIDIDDYDEWGWDLSEVSNKSLVEREWLRVAQVIAATTDINSEDALDVAKKYIKDDFVVVKTPDEEHAFAVKKLNTSLIVTPEGTINFEKYLEGLSMLPSVKAVVEAYGGTTIGFKNTNNPNVLSLNVVDENGVMLSPLFNVNINEAASPDGLAKLIQKKVNEEQLLSELETDFVNQRTEELTNNPDAPSANMYEYMLEQSQQSAPTIEEEFGQFMGSPSNVDTNVVRDLDTLLNDMQETPEQEVGDQSSLGDSITSFLSNFNPISTANATLYDDIQATLPNLNSAEEASEVTSFVTQQIIPQANTGEVPESKQLVVGEEAPAEMVGDMILSANPADVAVLYLGLDENSEEGAQAIRGMFDNIVGKEWRSDMPLSEFAQNTSWCAAFVANVLSQAGVKDLNKQLGTSDSFDQIRAISYLDIGTPIEPRQAQAGDVLIKIHTPEEQKKFSAGQAHNGIVVKVEGDEVYFIGGNTGDKVELSSYNINTADVRIRRVTSNDIPETKITPWLWQLKAGKAYRKSFNKLTDFLGFNQAVADEQ